MAFGGYDGSIKIDTKLNTKGFNAALGKIGSSLKSLAGAMGVAFGVTALIRFSKEAINTASDLQEVQNVVEVAFGSMTDKVEKFADTALEKFGLTELQAKKTASTYMAMNKGMGLDGEKAADMAIAAAGRTGDIASFYNMRQEEADTLMKSVWTGETESLKRIGVVMTEVNLQQYAYQKGITKSLSAMNQQEKVMLRYNYVMEQTALANGDFARTQDSWANQTRILSGQLKTLMGIMGKGLIQALTPAVKMLNRLMQSLISFAKAFEAVTAKLFGKQSLSEGAGKASGGLEDMAGAAEDYAEEVKKAEKAQKGFLSGLDEINNMPSQEAQGGSSGGGTVNIPSVEIGTDEPAEIGGNIKLSPKFEEILNKLKSIDLAPAKSSLDNFFESIKKFSEPVGEGLEWLFNNVLYPLGKWTIEKAVPAFLDLLSAALGVLTPIVSAAKEVLKWLWKEFLEPIAKWTGGIIIDVLKKLADKLKDIGDWLSEHQTLIENFILIIGSFAAAWGLVTLAMGAWNVAVGIWNAVGTIGAAVTSAFGAAVAFLTSPVTIAIAAIGALIAIVVLLVKNWDTVSTAAKKCWEWIVSTWHKAGEWFNNTVVKPISGFFSNLGKSIRNVFTATCDFIKTGLKNYVNGWIWIIESFLNFFIRGINSVINSLNKVSFKAPDFLGGKTFGVNIKPIPNYQIPKLAQGAVIPPNGEFAAILGDQKHGRNLEAPESLIRQIVREESGRGDVTVIVQHNDGREEEVFSTKKMSEMNRQSGKTLVVVPEG